MASSNITPIYSYWEWSFGTGRGDVFGLTASEWLSFLNYINKVRYNAGNGMVSFDTSGVVSDYPLTDILFNAARSAINGTSAHGTLPNVAVKQEDVLGTEHFDRAKTSINSAASAVWGQGDPKPEDYGRQTDED